MYDPKGKQISVGVGGDYFIGNSGDLGALGGRNKEVTWATILEKAMIKWNQIYQGSSNVGGIGTEYVSAILPATGKCRFRCKCIDCRRLATRGGSVAQTG